jgi:hypothetical protein
MRTQKDDISIVMLTIGVILIALLVVFSNMDDPVAPEVKTEPVQRVVISEQQDCGTDRIEINAIAGRPLCADRIIIWVERWSPLDRPQVTSATIDGKTVWMVHVPVEEY